MPIPPHTRLDHPLLNDVNSAPYSTLEPKLLTSQDEPRQQVRARAPFGRHRCPFYRTGMYWRSRNVSEPQLISSTKYAGESWFANLRAAHTVDHIASLLCEDDICTNVHSVQSAAVLRDTPSVRSLNSDDLHGTFLTLCEDPYDTLGILGSSNYKSEGSLYSTDSADQDAHPLLLSIPIIPRIKLERKATLRIPEPAPLSGVVQNKTLLSPRIPELRTPARASSRRYGRILSEPGALGAKSCDAQISQPPRRFVPTNLGNHPATKRAYQRPVSEPMLSYSCALDNDEGPILKHGMDDSPHSDLLLSMIDEVGKSLHPHNDGQEPGNDGARGPEQVPLRHPKRSQRWSSVNPSASFGGIIHAVADGCASLDLLLRKQRTKSKPKIEPKLIQNAHDPTSKWAPRQGQIFIKVLVPSTDDIWMFHVLQDINLVDFTSKVVTKLGFVVSFSGSVWDDPKYHFRTDERFKSWVKGRIRFGRNLPIVAHVLTPLSLVRLSVDADGCEVWCYA